MRFFDVLLGLVIPSVHAGGAVLDGVGAGNPGVAKMWDLICDVMPFCSLGTGAPAYFAGRVIGFLLEIIGGLAVAILIYAGIILIASQGNDEKLSEAKKIAMWALLGLVLAIIADAVLNYVISVINAAAS